MTSKDVSSMKKKREGNQRLDILGVGHASFTAINRRFYQHLMMAGYTVEIVVPRRLSGGDGREAATRTPEDPVIHWTEVKGRNNRFWKFTELRSILEKTKPRVIYLENDPACFMAVATSRWSAKNDAWVVCYININDIPPAWEMLRQGRLKACARTMLYKTITVFSRRRIHSVLAICRDGIEAMRAVGIGGKTVAMPLGYEAGFFYPNETARDAIRRKLGLTRTTIAYFGRVVKIKGVHVLLAALEKLQHLDWQFLIDEFSENSADTYANEIRAHINSTAWLAARTVTFHASHAEMPDYMNACDIAVLPSIWKEQYGRVIPEAMGCAKAVVVSDAGALPEIVLDAGVVTKRDDPDDLADALSCLLLNPLRRSEFSKKAYARAVQKLSIQAQLDVVGPILDEIIRPAKRAAKKL